VNHRVSSVAATLALTAALAGPGCTPEPSPWVRPRRVDGVAPARVLEPLPLRVEYGGCATVLLGGGGGDGVGTGDDSASASSNSNSSGDASATADASASAIVQCVYEPGATLNLWVTHEEGARPEFTMAGDGTWSMGEPYVLAEELGQGYRLQLEGEGLEAVTVTLPDRPPWRLELRAVGELEEREREELSALRRQTMELEKRIFEREFDALPQVDRLLDSMVQRGQLWNAVRGAAAIAFQLTWKAGRPKQAQRMLQRLQDAISSRLPDFERRYPQGSALLSVYLGHTFRRRGQWAEAASRYREGARLGRRVDDLQMVQDALAPYAMSLAELGYFEAAAYWSAQARDLAIEHASPYVLAMNLSMIARVSLSLRDANQVYDDPAPRLEELERIYGKGGPLGEYIEPQEAVLSRIELALLDDRPDEALAMLDAFEYELKTVDGLARIEEMRLRSLIQRGDDALTLHRSLERLERLADDAVGPELRWKTVMLEASVHETLGATDEATAAYARAEEVLDRLLLLAAVGLPGDFAAARHSRGTQRLVSLLVADGRLSDAICTIRRSRARIGWLSLLHRRLEPGSKSEISDAIDDYADALRLYETSLEDSSALALPAHHKARLDASQQRRELERRAFEILTEAGAYRPPPTCDDLAPRERGELLLVLYPRGTDLLIFIEDEDGVSALPVLVGYFESTPKNEDWSSDLLLQPLRERIEHARRVRVLASGKAQSIPVHALPWSSNDRDHDEDRFPLSLEVPVVYGLDLLPPSTETHATAGALLLADDQADGAQREVDDVARILRDSEWDVTSMQSRSRSASRVRALISEFDLFHYAGHAYYADGASRGVVSQADDDYSRRWPPYSGGAASEPSYIPLGRNGRLTVPDVLMLERVPRTVVLMGCATGVVDDRTAHGGFSLANAFLAAGSHAVIASTEEIEGTEAYGVARALYESKAFRDGLHPGDWLSGALRLLRARGQALSGVAGYRVYVP